MTETNDVFQLKMSISCACDNSAREGDSEAMTGGANRVASRASASRKQQASTHSANNLRGIFGGLERLGYDVEALIAPFGMRRSDVEDKDSCIAGQVCEAVLAKAQQERRVPNLPLRLAMEMPVGTNPLLDYIVASADTVGD